MKKEQIKQLRADLGWSQAQLGGYLGYTATAVMKWEKGMATPPPVIQGILTKLRQRLDRQRREQQKQEFIQGIAAVAVTGGVLAVLNYIFNDNDE
jgi:transcriptional regulator with XRE-family HTH domain